ncbi:MAG TPA: cyclic nucleotide-binding domain-containing protein, partial [Vicinamibacteria bacterium]|nr:cyclic nucleotide-binding domain-containing protein [Vicinamibacteria bacterium]
MYTVVEKVLFLQNVDLLSAARTEDLALLASISEEVLYPRNAWIFKEGQQADGLYVIIRGRVGLSKDGREVVTLGEKEALGAWT